MVTVTCQYSGIQFEAASRRSKNHPRVAVLLEAANRKGVYGDVVGAMAQAKRDGVTGEAVIEAAEAALAGGLKAAAEFNTRWRAEQREKREQESARIAKYRKNGPCIAAGAHDDEDDVAAIGEFDARPRRNAESEIYG